MRVKKDDYSRNIKVSSLGYYKEISVTELIKRIKENRYLFTVINYLDKLMFYVLNSSILSVK